MNFKALPLALMLVLAVAVLAACGGSDDTSTDSTPTIPDVSVDTANIAPYPQGVRDDFLKNCYATSDGEKAMCGCIMDAFEDTLPVDDFEALNNPEDGVAPPPLPTAAKDATNACVDAATQ